MARVQRESQGCRRCALGKKRKGRLRWGENLCYSGYKGVGPVGRVAHTAGSSSHPLRGGCPGPVLPASRLSWDMVKAGFYNLLNLSDFPKTPCPSVHSSQELGLASKKGRHRSAITRRRRAGSWTGTAQPWCWTSRACPDYCDLGTHCSSCCYFLIPKRVSLLPPTLD